MNDEPNGMALWTIETADDPHWILTEQDREMIRLAHHSDVDGPASLCFINAALAERVAQGKMTETQRNETYDWLQRMLEKLP